MQVVHPSNDDLHDQSNTWRRSYMSEMLAIRYAMIPNLAEYTLHVPLQVRHTTTTNHWF